MHSWLVRLTFNVAVEPFDKYNNDRSLHGIEQIERLLTFYRKRFRDLLSLERKQESSDISDGVVGARLDFNNFTGKSVLEWLVVGIFWIALTIPTRLDIGDFAMQKLASQAFLAGLWFETKCPLVCPAAYDYINYPVWEIKKLWKFFCIEEKLTKLFLFLLRSTTYGPQEIGSWLFRSCYGCSLRSAS